MVKRISKIASALLAICIVFSRPVFAETVMTEKEAKLSVNTEQSIEMWHYSGAYWQIGSGSSAIKVYDEDLSSEDISEYLNSAGISLKFSVNIPSAVKKAVSEGGSIKSWEIKKNYLAPEDLFYYSEFDKDSAVLGEDTLSFTLKPKFKFSADSFRDYVSGLNKSYPLLNSSRGYNLYSLYGNGKKAAYTQGYYEDTNSSYIKSGYMHPSIIADSSGRLKSGYTLSVGGSSMDSGGLYVGDGTFANGGALGYKFRYIIKVEFTYTYLEETQVPEGGEDPQADPDVPEVPEEPEAEAEDIIAKLSLPGTSYVGHKLTAKDESVITYGGEEISAARSYRDGIASASLSLEESDAGSVSKQTSTTYELSFKRPGTFAAKLRVRAGGLSSNDIKTVQVLKTPSVSLSLSGQQKQNRRQALQIIVAKDPNADLKDLQILIKDNASGESITVFQPIEGGLSENVPQALSNSENIKYRALKDAGSDLYFGVYELEFLSKFAEDRVFTAEVKATDVNGESSIAAREFTVLKDLPPQPEIELQSVYYRSEGSDTAQIAAQDITSETDDEFTRVWYIASPPVSKWISGNHTADFQGEIFALAADLEGYKDRSFGTGQSVEIPKSGVGPLAVKLKVKDNWGGSDTLEEYVTQADRLEGEAIAYSYVDNIAPVVSLGLYKAETAEIVLASADEALLDSVNSQINALKGSLREEGISADITTAKLYSSGVEAEDTYTSSGQIPRDTELYHMGLDDDKDYSFSTDYVSSWFWGTNNTAGHGNYTADSRYTYYMESALAADPADETLLKFNRTAPYKIICTDARSGGNETVWERTYTESQLHSETGFVNAFFGNDDKEKYLYLVSDGRTYVIDKKGGALAGTLPMEMGLYNCLGEEYVYCFADDGIYKAALDGSGCKKLHDIKIEGGFNRQRTTGGKMSFIASSDSGAMYLCRFDPLSEDLSILALGDTASNPYGTTHKLMCMDMTGKTVCYFNCTDGDRCREWAECYDTDGKMVSHIDIQTYTTSNAGTPETVSMNSAGECNYLILHDSVRTTSGTKHYLYVYDLRDGRKFSANLGATADYGFALELENDVLSFQTLSAEYTIFLPVAAERPIEYYVSTGGSGSSIKTGKKFNLMNGLTMWHDMGFFEGGIQLAKNIYESDSTLAYGVFYETEEQETERIKRKTIRGDRDYSLFKVIGEGFSAEDILSGIGEMKSEGAVSLVSDAASDYAAKKSVDLVPGRTYYYEYDTNADKDIFSAKKAASALIDPQDAGSDIYLPFEEHFEDFDDNDTDAFFTLSQRPADGKYGLSCKVSSSTTKYGNVNANFSFNIPDGCYGILSFDYDTNYGNTLYLPVTSNTGVTISKNGGAAKPWKRTEPLYDYKSTSRAVYDDRSGHYEHSELLGSGTYKVSHFINIYGTFGTANFDIDNVRVILLRKAESGEGAVQSEGFAIESNSEIKGSGADRHVIGSFTAPLNVLSYGTYENAEFYYSEAESGTYHSTEKTPYGSSYPNYNRAEKLNIAIPQGKKAAELSVKINPNGTYNSTALWASYDFPLSSDITHTYRVYSKATYSAEGPDLVLYAKDRSGSISINGTGTLTSRKYVNPDFGSIDMVLVPQDCPECIDLGQFYVSGDKMIVPRYYCADETELRFAADGESVRDFSLYYYEDGKKVYLENMSFRDPQALNGWVLGGESEIKAGPSAQEAAASRVFKKGESVSYGINYSDFESDPSKISYYRYTHTPGADELHPLSGKILNEPIDRFYLDGKYVLEHWQTDDASRGSGSSEYDKDSNLVSTVFYIEGNSGSAPHIDSMRTDPSELSDGDDYSLRLKIGDPDGDALDLVVEFYKDGSGVPCETLTRNDIRPNAKGEYPEIVFSALDAEDGSWEVVATLSDDDGMDIESIRFRVELSNELGASLRHTDAWELKRREYNEKYPSKQRSKNTFWPGEKILIDATFSGEIRNLKAELVGTSYSSGLVKSFAAGDSSKTLEIVTDQREGWGLEGPESFTVKLTATYAKGDSPKTCLLTVIFDQSGGSPYQLHRLW